MKTETCELTCFLVDRSDDDQISTKVTTLPADRLPPDEVLVEIQYSSLNYKDALAATGHPGVALNLPLVPGIDAVGTVVESKSTLAQPGQQVIIANAQFGTSRWGGWSTLTRVPGQWCVPLPENLSAQDAMVYGTAGFTAAQSIEKLQQHGIQPSDGDVVVTGATGGVGILAVYLLSQLGFQVTACTGKQDRANWLMSFGAAKVIDRSQLDDHSNKPMLKGRWAAAVDTVGGNILGSVIRSSKPGAVVTACGMVGGVELPITVYPFILRGVELCGIDSAGVSREFRSIIWNRLADQKTESLGPLSQVVKLSEISQSVDEIIKGKVAGRIVVKP